MMNKYNAKTVLSILLVTLLIQVIHSSPTSSVECSGAREVFVEKSETIDLASLAFRDAADAADGASECYWNFMTDGDYILIFSSSPDVADLFETYVEVYDGFQAVKPSLRSKQIAIKNERVLETSFSAAIIRIDFTNVLAALSYYDSNDDAWQLKIEKAVPCPLYLGVDENESRCDRIFDLDSCYCATFTERSWQEQFRYCQIYNMELVSLESLDEENAIQSAWTINELPKYWTSLSDSVREGYYIWSSTTTYLYPWGGGFGYANWGSNQPHSVSEEDDCIMVSNLITDVGWNDVPCTALFRAICELHPDTNPQTTTSSSNGTSTVSTTNTETTSSSSISTSTIASSTSTPPDFTCPEDNGFYPIDPYVCSSNYYNCVTGIAYPQTCPGNSVFDPNKLKCVSPEKCFICPEKDGNYPIDPKVCSPDYYYCENRTPYLKTCPGENVAFDPVNLWCTFLTNCNPI